MNSSRSQILGAIKKALQNQPAHKAEKPDFETPIYTTPEEDIAVVFVEGFKARKGIFYYAENQNDLINQLSEFITYRQMRKIYVWENNLLDYIKGATFPMITNDTNFEEVEAGITFCECLIARTGGMFVTSRQLSGRRLSIFPPVHIVVAFASQLLEDIKDGLEFIQKKYGSDMPSMISMVTGASRTADIEKTLVLGAHGPKELVLFLVDDLGE